MTAMWRTGGNIANGVSLIASADGRSSSKNNSHDAPPNSATAGNFSASSCGGGNTSAAESNLTPAKKPKANRDRNREHTRNTRLRKKAYLEKFTITVDALCRERDTLVNKRAGAASKLLEMYTIRTGVLISFFALRSCYEKRRELWSSILKRVIFLVSFRPRLIVAFQRVRYRYRNVNVRWVMLTVNAMQFGAKTEVSKQGM